ncbi:hypothetical protein F444_01398 [Phytophthora nicotianae P1976]|uniref:Uncharacterized protein n=1 Tax=Phytophthora nicotianae P1976 TaxID=1317066 RepID=A0A081B0Q4_PHYNI|nr:hypothetical protein F444_01398 [Phytophthora nicotianae P1976]
METAAAATASRSSTHLSNFNAGTVLLLKKLFLNRGQSKMYHSLSGKTAFLLGSVPLFGVVAYQSTLVKKTIVRSWHWRHYIFSNDSDDDEFRKTLRLPRPAFWKLLDIIELDTTRKRTNWCVPLSPAIRLCVYLYYAGHGCSLQQLSAQFGIGRSTASEIFKTVRESIVSRMENWISFSETRAELLELLRQFEQNHHLPGCVAAIDGFATFPTFSLQSQRATSFTTAKIFII